MPHIEASRKPWSGPPAGNVGIRADVLHSATPADAGTTAGMAGREACSTAGPKVVKIAAEREEIGGQ